MAYRIEKFNISIKFNCNGYISSNKFIEDKEFQKVFLFNFVTDKKENISASGIKVEKDFNTKEYVDSNLKNFLKFKAEDFITKVKDQKFYASFDLPRDKVIQIYFLRKDVFYCFSATISLETPISERTLLLNGTTKKLMNMINSITDLK